MENAGRCVYRFMKQLLPLLLFVLCSLQSAAQPGATRSLQPDKPQTIHVFVALCDNKYQGIVPVPARIGNGQDPDNNLYWGCGFGIRSYFKNSKEWQLVAKRGRNGYILERLVFRHRAKNTYLVADAWDGQFIKACTHDFLKSAAGQLKDTLRINHTILGIDGNARLLAYIGHDGLMDFSLSGDYNNVDGIRRDCIILACYSKRFFAPHLVKTKADPLVWTTGLMCPEAYSLHDALSSYLAGGTREQVRQSAIKAYSKYQKCSMKAAGNLLTAAY